MPTPPKGPRLGGSPAHQRHILANLATALFEHRRVTTTEAKARRLRPVAERLITFAKRGDLHARRQVLAVVPDKGVVHSLFTQIGPGFAGRAGGYTRITKIGPRKGDNAPMAVIELVAEDAAATSPRRRRARRARPAREAATPQTARPAAADVDAGGTAGVDEAGVDEAGVLDDAEAVDAEAVDAEPAAEADGGSAAAVGDEQAGEAGAPPEDGERA